jgi:hypothetical protein
MHHYEMNIFSLTNTSFRHGETVPSILNGTIALLLLRCVSSRRMHQ